MATNCLHKFRKELKAPLFINGEYREHINLPCGKCDRCLERRKMEWGFRMEYEMINSKTAYFVTLTYSPENVPYNKYGLKVLVKKDLQKFFKRLRQRQKRGDITIEHLRNNLSFNDKVKYYACGEYGEQFLRPHKHAIIYNASEKNILKSWELGDVHCVKANKYTIAYCMKYLDKWLGKKQDWKKPSEYNVMSKGIGEDYIQINKVWHKRNLDVLYVTNRLGHKIPMCKYYRNAIFEEKEKNIQVYLVEKALREAEIDSIKEFGIERHEKNIVRADIYGRKKFEHKIRKRIID